MSRTTTILSRWILPSSSRHGLARTLSTTSPRQAGRSTDSSRDNAGRRAAKDDKGNPIGREPEPILYQDWLDTQGKVFRNPKIDATNWLGGEVPFPLNPTFKPPPPLADALRNSIYTLWTTNPERNTPTMLSLRYGISIKRIEAIIRLKSHEAQWKKKRPLQTGFLKAMESATGVFAGQHARERREGVLPELKRRDDAAALDYDADWEQLPPTEVTPVYWEVVDEGKDPVVPTTLEAIAQKKLAKETAAHPPKSVTRYRSTTFVDVGGQFLHTNHKVKKSSRQHKGPHWVPEFTV